MILRYVRIEHIDAYERAGWFWRFADGALPGPHGHWSVGMSWLCDCEPGKVE